jgi:SAM-dependent methyltransferase
MSVAYKVLYGLNLTPWEEIAELPHVTQRVAALLAHEEAGREPPYGPALDLGCGSGIWALRLASRGWEVTGVDNVNKALRRARERADGAGISLRLVHADVTNLQGADVGSGFRFLLDLGLFHDELNDRQRSDMGRAVTTVAAPGATLLMVAWAPRRRWPLPRGASRHDIEAAYPAWTIVGEEPVDVSAAPFYRYMKKADPRLYRLRLSA